MISRNTAFTFKGKAVVALLT